MSEFPLFFETNKVKQYQDDVYSSSSNATALNVFDYNKKTNWESVDSDDSTTERLTSEFLQEDAQRESRTIDTVILSGINMKDFKLQYNNWNGSSFDGWTDIVGADITSNTEESLIISFSELTTWAIRIEMYNTIVVDEDKTITDFIATKLLWESTMPMDKFDIMNKRKTLIRRLYNGDGQIIDHYDKWAATMLFRQISSTEKNELKDIYDLKTAFIYLPEPYNEDGSYYKPENFYRVLWSSAWNEKYFTSVRSVGYDVKLLLEEK